MKKKVLFFYLLLLFVFVIVKFYGNIYDVIDRIKMIKTNRDEGLWNINLTSLSVVISYFRIMKENILHGNFVNFATLNIVGNIIPYIPFGILVPLNYEKCKNFFKFYFVSSLFIISLELFQFISLLGFCDIQDYILNIIGCCTGYVVYNVILIFIKKRKNNESD